MKELAPKLEALFRKVAAAQDEIDEGRTIMLKLSAELLEKEREFRGLTTRIRAEMDHDRERRHRLADHYYQLTEELHEKLEAHIASAGNSPKPKKEKP